MYGGIIHRRKILVTLLGTPAIDQSRDCNAFGYETILLKSMPEIADLLEKVHKKKHFFVYTE